MIFFRPNINIMHVYPLVFEHETSYIAQLENAYIKHIFAN